MTAQHANTDQPKRRGRKRTVLLALLCVAALAGAGLTAAFTTQNLTADNVISFGSVKLQIVETEQLDDGTVRTVPNNEEVKAQAGVASRIVEFKNVGASDLYVRAQPHMAVQAADGTDRGEADSVVEFAMDQTGAWTQGEDGWWYYNEPVSADAQAQGNITDPLMTGIEFVGDFYSVAGPGGKFVFTVDAQAVQIDNNGTSAQTAKGWPGEGEQN